MKKIISLLSLAMMLFSFEALSATRYEIQKSIDDETFIINDEVYKAKTYCFGFYEGDYVIFVEGNAYGACASAKIVNLRNGKTCNLWCE